MFSETYLKAIQDPEVLSLVNAIKATLRRAHDNECSTDELSQYSQDIQDFILALEQILTDRGCPEFLPTIQDVIRTYAEHLDAKQPIRFWLTPSKLLVD